MSHVQATPQAMSDAAGNLSAIGSTINTANSTAASGTAGVQAPGGDEVSAYVTALFAAHAQNYQVASAHAASYHDQFVQAMRASAGSYANTEANNASLQHAGGTFSSSGQTSAGHLTGNGANGSPGAGHHDSDGGPLTGNGDTRGPGGGNPGAGGSGAPGPAAAPGPAGHAAANAGPQSGDAGGGGGAPSGGGGGAGEAADSGGGGGGAGSASGAGARDVAGAGVPTAFGPASPAPAGPPVPGLATAPGAPAVMASGYSATAGLAGFAGVGGGALSGGSPAIAGLGEPAAPAVVSPAAGSLAAEPALATTKAQPVHPGNPSRSGDAAHPSDGHHDIPALPIPLPSLRGLRRKLREGSGLRDKKEWLKELRTPPEKEPWGRDELLGALGLRPPGSEMTDRVGGVSAPAPPTPRSE